MIRLLVSWLKGLFSKPGLPSEVVKKTGLDKRQENDLQIDDSVKQLQWSMERFKVDPEPGKTRFHDFNLPLDLMHAIADLGWNYCMPVQAEAIPQCLKGSDLFARAQTGTGKTAAFLVTIIAKFLNDPGKGKLGNGKPRALILAPTRELVLQIERDAKALLCHTKLEVLSVFGGMDYNKQQNLLKSRPVDIVAATPGRLMDFMRSRTVILKNVEILVIDEADRMLDMGFIPDIRKIIQATPYKDKRQTLFFSATLSPEILRIASQWTKGAVEIVIDPDKAAAASVNQKVYIVTEEEKLVLLVNLVQKENLDRVIVFVNRKDTARNLAIKLDQYQLKNQVLSGDIAQKKRVQTLEDFRNGRLQILVATDVAARGLHIEGVSHVINYDLPEDPEHYVHRIGRTGRAGAEGISVSFADEMSSFNIPKIEEVLGNRLSCEYPDEALLAKLPKPKREPVKQGKNKFTGGKKKQGGYQRTSSPKKGRRYGNKKAQRSKGS